MDLSLNSRRTDEDMDKKEPEQLFEESWFFANLLLQTSKSKPKKMVRSLSDPTARTPSSSSSYKPYGHDRPNLIKKAPSMPSALKGSDLSIRSNTPSSRSLDSEEDEEYDEDEEIEFSMGELIRQASMRCSASGSSSSSFSPKCAATISSRSRQLQPWKSLTTKTLKSRELQGFRDLGFEFDEPDFDPNNIASTVSTAGFRDDGKRTEEKNINHSSYYIRRSSEQPIPKWGAKRSSSTSNELMKERIKFWARAVAYNLRQECC